MRLTKESSSEWLPASVGVIKLNFDRCSLDNLEQLGIVGGGGGGGGEVGLCCVCCWGLDQRSFW